MRKIDSKIVPLSSLGSLAKSLKREKKRIVTTNGCFDLLHWGHLHYLYQARAMGDVLIVGLNSDGSVRKLKGATRPLFDEKTRLNQLASIEWVDFVSLFKEDTPEAFLKLVEPAIHVKGGDYQAEKLPERGCVEAAGGRVVCLPFIPGFSSSDLIERILKLHAE